MITLSSAATAVLIAVLAQLLLITPLAFAVLKAWLRIKENQYKLNQVPTREEVNTQVNGVVNRLLTETNGKPKESGAP